MSKFILGIVQVPSDIYIRMEDDYAPPELKNRFLFSNLETDSYRSYSPDLCRKYQEIFDEDTDERIEESLDSIHCYFDSDTCIEDDYDYRILIPEYAEDLQQDSIRDYGVISIEYNNKDEAKASLIK